MPPAIVLPQTFSTVKRVGSFILAHQELDTRASSATTRRDTLHGVQGSFAPRQWPEARLAVVKLHAPVVKQQQ